MSDDEKWDLLCQIREMETYLTERGEFLTSGVDEKSDILTMRNVHLILDRKIYNMQIESRIRDMVSIFANVLNMAISTNSSS